MNSYFDICHSFSNMAVKNEIQSCVSRRKARKPVIVSIKDERKAYYKKVALILKKPEEIRSDDEKSFLSTCCEFVKEITRRIETRQKLKERKREVEDAPEVLAEKCHHLAEAIRNSRHLIVYTGAGISTAAEIPDYRGSSGIWTLLQQGKDIGHHDLTKAEPTTAHMALFELHRTGILKYIVSQNCDGLHLRSGVPRYALSELHGNMYLEVCQECKPVREYWRLFDVTERTARFNHRTMRRCYICCSPLVDTIVHFGESGKLKWPINWPGASKAADKADIILCMGSSLKVLKRYRRLWRMDEPAKSRPKLYIVNLQWTPKDGQAVLKISGKCDEVMKRVMDYLKLAVPDYCRNRDPIFSHSTSLHPAERHTTSRPCLSLPLGIDEGLKEEHSVEMSESAPSGLFFSNSAVERSIEYNSRMRAEKKENCESCLISGGDTDVPVNRHLVWCSEQENIRPLHQERKTIPLLCLNVESGSEMNDCRIICREHVQESGVSSPIEIVYEGVKLKVGERTVDADACYELSFSYCCSCCVEKVLFDKCQCMLPDRMGHFENSHFEFTGKSNMTERCCQVVMSVNKISVKQTIPFVARGSLLKSGESTSSGKNNPNDNYLNMGSSPICDTLCAGEKKHYFKNISECDSDAALETAISIKSGTNDRSLSSVVQCSDNCYIQEKDHLLGKLSVENKTRCSALERLNNSLPAENCICDSVECCTVHPNGPELISKAPSHGTTNYCKSTLLRNSQKKKSTFLQSQWKLKNKLEDIKNSGRSKDSQNLTKCLFCKLNYNSSTCLFYYPGIPNFKGTTATKDSTVIQGFCVCMCCKHRDGNIRCDRTMQYNKTRRTVRKEVIKELNNPGWFGKGHRKLTRKKRR